MKVSAIVDSTEAPFRHSQAPVRRRLLKICGVLTVALLLSSCQKSAEDVARAYQTRRVAGDLIPILGMLTYWDSVALKDGYPENVKDLGLGLSTGGRPATTVDSLKRIGRLRNDTMTFVAYMTGPNWEQALSGVMATAMSGQLPDERYLKGAAPSLPRVTSVDSIVVVQEGGRWKILLEVEDRRRLQSLQRSLSDGYLKVPLRLRIPAALAYLKLASQLKDIASKEFLHEAQDLRKQAAYLDSLEISLRITEGYFLNGVAGTITNRSAAQIKEHWIQVRDARGKESSIRVYRVPARGAKDVYDETTLASGRPASTEVLTLELDNAP